MSQIDYSLPEFCERKEWVRFPPDQPFVEPNNDVAQRKNIVYTINDRSGIYDYANAYFKVSFDIRYKKYTGASLEEKAFIATDKTTLINGVHSLIHRISVSGGDGRIVYEYVNANLGNSWKKILTYSPAYASTIATNEFFYFDDDDLGIAKSGHNNRVLISSSSTKTDDLQKLNFNIPLSSFSYFESLRFNNVFLTGQQIRIFIDIDTDQNLIWQPTISQSTPVDKPEGRVVITTMDLMIPQLSLHPDAYSAYISSIETPLEWTYLRERVEPFGPTQTTSGRFKITGVNEPQELLFWFVSDKRLNNRGYNPYFADEMVGGIGKDATLNSCRLEFSNGEIYPRVDYLIGKDNTDISRLFYDVQEYVHNNENIGGAGSLLNRAVFEEYYSCIYFDLKFQKRQLVSDVRDFTFVYHLDRKPNELYNVFCYIKYKETATFGKVDNQYIITSEVGSTAIS